MILCLFTVFLLNPSFGRMKCSFPATLWFFSIMPAPNSEAGSLASHSIWELFRPCTNTVAQTFQDIYTLSMSFAAPGLWEWNNNQFHNHPHHHIRRLMHQTVFLFSSAVYFVFFSLKVTTVAEEACRPDQCPAGAAGRSQTFDRGFLQITFLLSLLPLFLTFCRFSLSVCLSPCCCGSLDYGVGL